MADDFDDHRRNSNLHANQPYDESLDIPDSEEVASQYTPTPRIDIRKADRSGNALKKNMSEESDDDFRIGTSSAMQQKPSKLAEKPSGGIGGGGKMKKPYNEDEDDDEETGSSDDGEDDDDEDDDDDDGSHAMEGAYNAADYEHLAVSSEIKELFQYITRYTPQNVDLEHRLKPFIPDFIPAVGDIDAFIKIPRHDGKPDSLGLTVLDEPCAKQSDPTVLDLMMRSITKQTNMAKVAVRSIDNASQTPKAIESWIKSIADLHKTKPLPTVHYSKNMPDIDQLMEEWPPEFEEVLNQVSLPTADMECDLPQFVDIVCGILDIPVHKSRVQSLHLLFSVFSEFKNSQHFQAMSGNGGGSIINSSRGVNADRLEL